MDVDDIVTCTAQLLAIDFSQEDKQQFAILLHRELLRENRRLAEERGIGKAAALPPYRYDSLYAVFGTDNMFEVFELAPMHRVCASLK
jgi:hypothetical protein